MGQKETKQVNTAIGVEKITFEGKTLDEIKEVAKQMNEEARKKAKE